MRTLAEVEHELREIANLSSDILLRLNNLHQDVAGLLIASRVVEERQRRHDDE
jgi:hypothetical protein